MKTASKKMKKKLILTAANGCKVYLRTHPRTLPGHRVEIIPWLRIQNPRDPARETWDWAHTVRSVELIMAAAVDEPFTAAETAQVFEAIKATGYDIEDERVIPQRPDKVYGKEWKGWGDLLGIPTQHAIMVKQKGQGAYLAEVHVVETGKVFETGEREMVARIVDEPEELNVPYGSPTWKAMKENYAWGWHGLRSECGTYYGVRPIVPDELAALREEIRLAGQKKAEPKESGVYVPALGFEGPASLADEFDEGPRSRGPRRYAEEEDDHA